ncbi:MAG: CinA family protein, partial [Rikenellaceae bacterium]|nr:CinA family protein [Rikenellaceae bacterium]
TGIAGPDGGTDVKPVGTVCMALAAPEGTFTRKRLFRTLREQNISRATAMVIDMLRLYLSGENL